MESEESNATLSTKPSLQVGRERPNIGAVRSSSSSKLLFLSEEKSKQPDVDLKVIPKKPILNNKNASVRPKIQISSTSRANASSAKRPCQTHSFLTDTTDVRQMEQGLLSLLGDFHSGKLKAFDCSYDKMEKIREQQEKLAKLHFELGANQDIKKSQTEEAQTISKDNFQKLIENLQNLSTSIEQLQSSNPD